MTDIGTYKYPQLFPLAKCVLSLSVGDSVTVRGFSIYRYLLDVHCHSTSEITLEYLRLVKDKTCHVGGVVKFSVSRDLISSVKGPKYVADPDDEKSVKRNEKWIKKRKASTSLKS